MNDPIYIVLPSDAVVKYDGSKLTRYFDGIPWSAYVVRPRITATLSRDESTVDFALDTDIDVPHELRKQLTEMWADGAAYFAGDTLEADPVWCSFSGDDRAFARECERLGLLAEFSDGGAR